jgi:predicted small lipoprotein YifL
MSLSVRFLLIAGLFLTATACGKKGPLIYPDMLLPAAPAAVSVQQSGAAVKLQFAIPDKDRAGRALRDVAGLKISRRVSDSDQKELCRSCMADYGLFRTIYLDHLPADTQRFANQIVLLDSDVAAGNLYSYSIVTFTADGADGVSSSTVSARVAAPLPAPVLKAESFPTEVKLHITSQQPESGSLLGYNLYRRSAATARSYQTLNKEPLKDSKYVDATLERGVQYLYSAKELIVLESGEVMESAESNEAVGMLKDDE